MRTAPRCAPQRPTGVARHGKRLTHHGFSGTPLPWIRKTGDFSAMPASPYDHRVSIHVTGAMHTRLTRLADDRNLPIAELARDALREYLDQQEDVHGSRKHFTKGFQRRIDFIEWQLFVLLWLVARSFAYLISNASGKKLAPETLIEQSLKLAQERRVWMTDQLLNTSSRPEEDQ